MDRSLLTIKGFLSCFNQFAFNIVKRERRGASIDSEAYLQSDIHLLKMMQSAKKDLTSAKRAFKNGKISSDELFDYEWRINELEQEMKDLKDFTDNNN